jgi:hypothetical protein
VTAAPSRVIASPVEVTAGRSIEPLAANSCRTGSMVAALAVSADQQKVRRFMAFPFIYPLIELSTRFRKLQILESAVPQNTLR